MKINTSILLTLAFLLSCSGSTKTQTPPTGQKITTSDALYELYVPNEWQTVPMQDSKVEHMLITQDKLARFFVMRIPNPPHASIDDAQINAFIDGIKGRHQNVEIISQKLDQRSGTPTGTIIYLFDETSPQGPLTIRNFCEIAIHKANYFNFCAMAPTSVWDKKRAEVLAIFPTLKYL